MSNYFEYKDKIAFHPGYYVKEIIDEFGITQEDFAMRLGTTPKNLSKLVNGEQRLSTDMAIKLSGLIGNSVTFWLNLQNAYDSVMAEFEMDQELEKEKSILEALDYNYFRGYFGLPDLPRKKNEQVEAIRSFLKLSSLTVLAKYDMAASYRNITGVPLTDNKIRANAMVQIAINHALQIDAPKYNKQKMLRAAKYALTLTDHDGFYNSLCDALREAGVVLEIIPDHTGSKVNGAAKKIGDKVMLMINDKQLTSDAFWFTLFNEIGHILNGDFGMSMEDDMNEREESANRYAADSLVPPDKYDAFIAGNQYFSPDVIVDFAKEIDRDPGIVLGRLQIDHRVERNDREMDELRRHYKIALDKKV